MLAYKAPVCQRTSEAPMYQTVSTDTFLLLFLVQLRKFIVRNIIGMGRDEMDWEKGNGNGTICGVAVVMNLHVSVSLKR